MNDYHKYVFDPKARQLVGDFETMYQAEEAEGFDSWHERDLRPLRKQIALQMLSDYNFSSIVEVGCGKGAFTHLLKKKNNRVLATDLSATAIMRAAQSYPDIDFRMMSMDDVLGLEERFDLALVMGTLAYVENWREAIAGLSRLAEWCFVAEYVPENPIGCVKSIDDLTTAFAETYDIASKIVIDDHHCLLLGQRR
jgi:trans-aconitate methyltransferase